MQDLVVLSANADGPDDVGAKVIEQFPGYDYLADQAHAKAPGLGLDDDDALAFDQFTIAFAGSATGSLFAEHYDPVDVALVLTCGAIPFDGRELLDKQPFSLVCRAPVPARHRGLVFAHVYQLIVL